MRLKLGILIGVAITALLHYSIVPCYRALWEREAWEHYAGYYELSVWDRRCFFHWYQ